MKKSEIRKLIREVIQEETGLSEDTIIDSLSELSLSLTDIQKQLVQSGHQDEASKLMVAQQNIQDVQNLLA